MLVDIDVWKKGTFLVCGNSQRETACSDFPLEGLNSASTLNIIGVSQ